MKPKNIGILTSIIIGVAVISAIFVSTNTTQTDIDKYAVNADTVKVLLQNSERVLVVDIRTAEQYQSGHLFGASHDVLDSTTLENE